MSRCARARAHTHRNNNEGCNEIKCVKYKCYTLYKGKFDSGLIRVYPTESRIWYVFNLYFKMAYIDMLPFCMRVWLILDFCIHSLFLSFSLAIYTIYCRSVCAAQIWVFYPFTHSSLKPLFSTPAAYLIIAAIHLLRLSLSDNRECYRTIIHAKMMHTHIEVQFHENLASYKRLPSAKSKLKWNNVDFTGNIWHASG